MELSGRIALVTGAGLGIGRATALKLARQGADLAILSYVAQEVDEVANQIEALGGKVLPLVVDVSDAAQMADAFEKISRTYGRLDIVHANAGINGTFSSIEEMTVEEWDRVHHTNLRGTFLTVHHTIPLMKQDGGAIVITSSINGTTSFSFPGTSAYGATKMGQISFTKVAALELSKHKIRVNAVCPGGISTNIENTTIFRDIENTRFPIDYPKGQIPINDGERGDPEDIAETVLFLVSDRARHITGTTITVDGGQTLVT